MLGRYVVQRLLQLIPVLFLVSLVVFLLVQLIPGDPILVMLGADAEEGATYNEAQYEELQRQLGMDQPVVVRYLHWAGKVLRGDLGASLKSRRPVMDVILERYPATIQLAVVSVLVGLVISVPAGIIAAVRQNTGADYAAMAFALAGVAIPSFWLALMLILLFSLQLGWLPSIGYANPLQDPGRFLRHAALPALVLGTAMAAQLTRYLRAEMLEQLNQDYVRAARARGLPERSVILAHAARNSLLAVVTVIGLEMARLLGGSTIVEAVFSWPGVASLLIEAIYARDFPVVQGAVLILAVTYVFINLLVDILYKWLDPRIRLD